MSTRDGQGCSDREVDEVGATNNSNESHGNNAVLAEIRNAIKTDITHVITGIEVRLDSKLTHIVTELEDKLDSKLTQVKTDLENQLGTRLTQVKTGLENQFETKLTQVKTDLENQLEIKLDTLQNDVKELRHQLQNEIEELRDDNSYRVAAGRYLYNNVTLARSDLRDAEERTPFAGFGGPRDDYLSFFDQG